MKTAIYIEDGAIQLVITPETEFEKNAVSTFRDKQLLVQIFSGTFYDCRGGWTKQSDFIQPYQWEQRDANDQSIIIRIDETEKIAK